LIAKRTSAAVDEMIDFVWRDPESFVHLCYSNRWVHRLLPAAKAEEVESLIRQIAHGVEPYLQNRSGEEFIIEAEEVDFRSFEINLYEARRDRKGFTTERRKGVFIQGFMAEVD
jgi:hypothetical protein